MPLKIATWNINSIRLRRPMVEEFLAEHQPDILCLQEIKCTNDQFPAKEFAAAGYPHQAVNGQKAYHGVATISRLPLINSANKMFCNIDHARHVSCQVEFDQTPLNIHNFYVPAGGDVPDVSVNEKFKHKMDFLAEMKTWFQLPEFSKEQIIVGDFNIAPHENDVWSHKQLLKIVSHTPLETNTLDELLAHNKWVDLIRQHISTDEKLYSWWSYRAKDWNASNKGRRLDHIWSTKDLAVKSVSSQILREARGWSEKPSDHVPVIVELK
ncbi:MAG: exodeoxyribonuclease III [Devosiaceae bacterium]|nr:exodeoxyribonuclease III [Devosiaceae bacterium]